MLCGNCGVEMIAGAAFCPSCGKPASMTAAPSGAVAAPALPPNVAGMLCYLAGFVTGILFLALAHYRQDRFVRFHAFQAIFLSVAWIALYLVLGIFLAMLPGALWGVGRMLYPLVSLAGFLLWLLLMRKAYQNERFRLPVIGNLAAERTPEDKPSPRAAA